MNVFETERPHTSNASPPPLRYTYYVLLLIVRAHKSQIWSRKAYKDFTEGDLSRVYKICLQISSKSDQAKELSLRNINNLTNLAALGTATWSLTGLTWPTAYPKEPQARSTINKNVVCFLATAVKTACLSLVRHEGIQKILWTIRIHVLMEDVTWDMLESLFPFPLRRPWRERDKPQNTVTECRGQVFKTPASYSGGPTLKYQPGDRLPLSRFSWSTSVLPGEYWDNIP